MCRRKFNINQRHFTRFDKNIKIQFRNFNSKQVDAIPMRDKFKPSFYVCFPSKADRIFLFEENGIRQFERRRERGKKISSGLFQSSLQFKTSLKYTQNGLQGFAKSDYRRVKET